MKNNLLLLLFALLLLAACTPAKPKPSAVRVVISPAPAIQEAPPLPAWTNDSVEGCVTAFDHVQSTDTYAPCTLRSRSVI